MNENMIYIGNAFSINMISSEKDNVIINFQKIGLDEFCDAVRKGKSVIGHPATAELVAKICNVNEDLFNREAITINENDTLYVISIRERLPEGKILNYEELLQKMSEGKIQFYKIKML